LDTRPHIEHTDKETWILNSITGFLMRNALSSILASLLVVCVFAWANRSTLVESTSAMAWAITGIVLGCVRVTHYILYSRKQWLLTTLQWIKSYRLLTFFSGSLYGVMTVIFFNQVSTALQVFTMFIVVGMPAAAVGTHAVDKITFRLFMVTITIPAAIILYLTGDSVYQMVSFLIFVFTFIMDKSANRTTHTILENIEMTYTMSYRATHDSLVGLFNREELEHQFEMKAPRSSRSIAMMFIDLDDFKPLNDTLGHQAGDIALKNVADIIKLAIRPDDIAARLGGDEFVVILFLDDLNEAEAIAQTILTRIRNLEFDARYEGLSCSIGIGYYHSTQVGFSRLMRVADMACYESKESGKNKVTILHYTPQ
jgi:diguanylate cyclase (GGDEF)-like protein